MGMIGNTLALGLVSGANIQDGTVDTADIKDAAITTSKIADSAVVTADIADGAVTPAKLGLSALTANAVAFLNGSKVLTTGSALTFDGSNLGIGTSSPNYVATLYKASLPVLQLANSTSGSTAGDGLLIYLNGANATISNEEAGSIGFQTSGTLRATLDSSGNLGLGVTPNSGWDTGVMRALQVGTGATFAGDTPGAAFRARILANAYYGSGAYRYIGSGPALLHTVNANSSTFEWNIAGSGTAGNAISFTQAMTLDASGQLMVGKTSNSYGDASTRTFEISGSSSSIVALQYGGANGYYLQVNSTAGYLWNSANTPIVFGTNNTERARIDSSGNLLVGTTSPLNNGRLSVNQTNASFDAVVSVVAGSTQSFYAGIFGGNFRYYVLGTGQINAIFTSIQAISDRRAKQNIQDMRYGLSEVMALRPVTFDHINSVAEDSVDNYGFIADEVEQVLPELVSESKNSAPDGTPYQTLKMGDMLPVLVKAIQEQQAIIEQLKADVAALKG